MVERSMPVFKLYEKVTLEEDYEHEFKAITGYPPFNHIKKDVEEYIVAFLNTNGGAIYFGIENDGTVTGLLMNRQEKDEARNFIDQKITGIQPSILPECVTVEFCEVYAEDELHKDLCVLKVSTIKGTECLYYTSNQKAIMRLSGGNYTLNPVQVEQRYADCLRKKIESEIKINEWKQTSTDNISEIEAVDIEAARKGWINYLNKIIYRFSSILQEELSLPWTYEQNGEALDLEPKVRAFLTSDTDRVLIIVGRPGGGKTTYLQNLVSTLAEEAMANLDADKNLARPETIIPLYVNLNSYRNDPSISFAIRILQDSDLFQYIISDPLFDANQPEKVFLHPPSSFLVCLDALDEVDVSTRDESLDIIMQFIKKFTKLRIIVTGRPGMIRGDWRQFETISIAPLDEIEVQKYFNRYLAGVTQEALEFLTIEPDLFELMHIPLLLKATKDYWEQIVNERKAVQEPAEEVWEENSPGESLPGPSKATLINYLISTIFEWEADKSRYRGFELKGWEWSDMLGELAYWMDGHRKHFLRQQALQFVKTELPRFCSMGIIQPRHPRFRFINDLIQLYFAAYILPAKIDQELDWICEQAAKKTDWWWKCIEFAEELGFIDVTPVREYISNLSKT